MLKSVLDNDLLIKGLCYGLLGELIAAIPSKPNNCGVLQASRFVVRSVLSRHGQSSLLSDFEAFLQSAAILEPSDPEIASASELEHAAQRAGRNLDPGESLLCAIVGHRSLLWMATGDKRAIESFEIVLTPLGQIDWLRGKMISLEQLFHRIINTHDPAEVRSKICSNSETDRTLTICFSCSNPDQDPDSWKGALQSYIDHLRSKAPTVLAN